MVLARRHLMIVSTARHLSVLHVEPTMWTTLVLSLRIVTHLCHCILVSLLMFSTSRVLGLTLSWMWLHHHLGSRRYHERLTRLMTLLRSLMAHRMTTGACTVISRLLSVVGKVWLYVARTGRRIHLHRLSHRSTHERTVRSLLHHHVPTHLRSLRTELWS